MRIRIFMGAKPGLLLGVLDGGASLLERRVLRLMEGRVVWAPGRRWAAMVGCVSMMGVLSAGVVMAGVRPLLPVMAQILHVAGPLPKYEVATIKPDNGGPVGSGAKNVRTSIGTTRVLIESAYNIPVSAHERLIGGPSWIASERYVIEGKVPDELFARMEKMSGPESRTQNSLMKQSLLADRFKFKMHFEMREMPAYELVLAKGGAKVKAAKADAAPSPWPQSARYMNTFGPRNGLVVGRGAQGLEMTARGMQMDQLAQSLQEAVPELGGRTIVDKTGLAGQYDFTMNWTEQTAAAAGGDGPAANASEGPSIFTALQEQLGLKLVPAKGMVEVIVIDGIERPTEN